MSNLRELEGQKIKNKEHRKVPVYDPASAVFSEDKMQVRGGKGKKTI